ncbi:MAG: hypothetical protein DCF18_10450 [Cyanobium sp.]|jgi:hypothetical protein|uniref:hypothetical protein n=1 Tax=Synechococcus sp. CS-1333 TaxID=2848638 RepID=UPI000DBBE2C5|nr:hypothetical protein [Synechococcus sp. CS-1333]MCT0210169.1 hypothetical protein [Synechococcus sp. CS-1333]PZV22168.1 MAG: hypothetical protein DCF18_10450 [Cyanobium sp.]
MSAVTPPWCLHWGRDGELDSRDRQDVLDALLVQEQGLARLLLHQARPGALPPRPPECQQRQLWRHWLAP